MASQNILKVVSTTSERLGQLPIEFGQLIFVKDTKELYFDHKEGRTLYNQQIIVLEKESDRTAMNKPVVGFYFVQETGIIWRYDTAWVKLTNAPSEQIEFISKKDFPAEGKANILYIDGIRIYRWIKTEYVEMGLPVWESF